MDLLIFFRHGQSHVMINGDAHTFKGDNSSFYSPLQYEYYRQRFGFRMSVYKIYFHYDKNEAVTRN
jgi:hypothetical protein